ncbi:SAV_2336 N-terminal domain-related protein [Streptomyces collinus]|uniref:SAV_2336 N-terminal domain-related protein n=1 Tax=Streptomyces collinus TaxID=42684 RepID=UPI0033AF97E2
MPGMRLDELIGKLRQGGLDPTAEDVADAVWLARRLGAAPPSEARGQPDGTLDGAPAADTEHTDDAHHAADGDAADDAGGAAGRGAARPADGASPGPGPAGSTADAPAAPVPLLTPGPTVRPQAGAAAPAAFPVRAPAAAALPGLLGLEKALRALGRYRVASARSGDERIDEEATADRAAASGILLPVTRPGRRRRCDVQLLMDTGPAMAVWGQLVEELRQACQQSGAFSSVRVHHLYADDSGAPLIGTTAGPGRHTRLRPADELHDPTGRRITFVISDCVGPLWQNGSAQRLLHHWPRTAPLAVVQPLPPRLWGRTALPAEPGLLLRPAEVGGRLGFRPDDEPWEEPAPGARPVPVLQPTPEAFEAFARLLGGAGPTSERAWAALTDPATPPPAALAAPAAPAPRGDHDLLRAFRAGASPGALRLAVYLAAAPLTLPVMQLVQRAMLPDTGPTELAEVLLGGLLRQLPGTEDHPCFAYPGRVQDLLLSSLDQDTAGLVLKHCSAYVERHFGRGTRNFAALAAARLADQDPAAGAGPLPEGTGAPGDGGVEAELFASIPARVLRFYLPDLVTPEPLTEAERLLGQWHRLADPEVLRRAREQALAAVAPGAAPGGPRPHLVLGRILRAEAGTVAARTTGGRAELLREAATALAAAHAAAPGDSRERAEAALELAGCRRELWQLTAESDPLAQALEVLDPGLAPWPGLAERAREWFSSRPDDAAPATDGDALPGGHAVPGAEALPGGDAFRDGAGPRDGQAFRAGDALPSGDALPGGDAFRERDGLPGGAGPRDGHAFPGGGALPGGDAFRERDGLPGGVGPHDGHALRDGDAFRDGDALPGGAGPRDGDALPSGGALPGGDAFRERDGLPGGVGPHDGHALRDGDAFRDGDALPGGAGPRDGDALPSGGALPGGDAFRERDGLPGGAGPRDGHALRDGDPLAGGDALPGGDAFRERGGLPDDGALPGEDARPEPGAGAAEQGAGPAVPGAGARAARPQDDVTGTAAPVPRTWDDVPWDVTAHRSRLLLRGRILLDLRHPGAAAGELREACALLDAEAAADAVRAPALLELARALRESGAEDGETRQALLRARRSAGDDPGLLLPCLAALAAFHDAAGEAREADTAYERAALLAPAEGALRCRLLTSWGESLLRRASARDGAGTVDRAEYVLREALKSLPARSTQRGRLQGLVGSALAQRFRHLGFLPDLFESRHLLGQALRAAADAAVRAEVWLQLGRVRLEGWYHAGAPVLMDALQAYENAEREAQSAYGADPGSTTAARARYGSGTVLALMGRPGAARGAYRAARDQWQRLVAALREVDWADVELSRAAPAEPLASAGRLMPEEQWREAAPPWWPWTQEWNNSAELDRS